MERDEEWRPKRSGWGDSWGGSHGVVAAAVVFVFVGLFLLLPLAATSTPVAREITLVTRDMAFYLEGDTRPNPTIRLQAGERVRFVLRNLDPGIDHNLAIDDWDWRLVRSRLTPLPPSSSRRRRGPVRRATPVPRTVR